MSHTMSHTPSLTELRHRARTAFVLQARALADRPAARASARRVPRPWLYALFLVLALCTAATAGSQEWIYVAAPGDNLWNLSEKYLKHVGYFRRLQRLNNIERPRRMPPGTRIRVPMAWIRVTPAQVEVVATQGESYLYRNGAAEVQRLAAGQRITLGDRLETGTEASVALRFADGSRLTVHGDARLDFDHLSAYGETGMADTRMHLQRGEVDAASPPAAGPGARFDIRTPAAVTAVRGTGYRVATTADGQSARLEVLKGRVAVSGAGKRRTVPAGRGTRVERGHPPPPPRRLLPAPDLAQLPQRLERLSWPLTWAPLSGAAGYRVQVADRADFATLLWERSLDGTRALFPDLPDGEYYVRVRGRDAQGLEGFDAVQRLELDARPQPPVLLQPMPDRIFRDTQPRLRWTGAEEAHSYRLQVADLEDFVRPLADIEGLTATDIAVPGVSGYGRFYWRLASIAADGEQGPFGDPRAFEIRPQPPKPEATLEARDGRILASWQAGSPGQRYRVQVAEDPLFTQPLLEQETEQPSLWLEEATQGVRYLRVQILEPDGYAGPWGAVQKIDPVTNRGWLLWVLPAALLILLL
jgi:hypothetical protein